MPAEPWLDRVAAWLVEPRLSRREAIQVAAAGAIVMTAGPGVGAMAQAADPICGPAGIPQSQALICPIDPAPVPGFTFICCNPTDVCCTNQPSVNGGYGCCSAGQTCCLVRGLWGCCGCPVGQIQCGPNPDSQCCAADQKCDVERFVCVPGDTCPDVVCDGRCCAPGETCAGGTCCLPSQACPDRCCGRGELCDGGTCKELLRYQRPKRQRPTTDRRLDSPKLQSFDEDLALDVSYTGLLSGLHAARAQTIAKASVHLPANTTRTLHLTITPTARRLLDRGRSLPATLTVTFRTSAGMTLTESTAVTIEPPRRRRSRR